METDIKKTFSRIGFSYLSMGLVAILFQIIISIIISNTYPQILSNQSITTILASFSQYVLPIPILYYLLRKIKKTNIEKHSVGISTFLIFICITFVLMYIGNLIGLGITEIISLLKQNSVVNPITDLIQTSDIWINLLLISIIGPVFEEIFFRKMLIDRTIQYGAKISVFLSALMFGLFHGNLNQFFYAFLLGGFFAIIYIKTGNILYTIILHMITNLSGSVIAMGMQTTIESLGNTPAGIIVTLAYLLVLFILCLVGIIFIIKWKDKLMELKNNIPHALKTSILNVGMICFILYCLIEVVYVILI